MNHDYDYPAMFTLDQPENEAVVGSDTVAFNWSPSAVGHQALTMNYIIEIAADSNFNDYISLSLNDTFVVIDSIGDRDLVSKCYWRVKAINSLDMLTYAEPGIDGWSFTIDITALPPTTFLLNAPYPNPFNNSARIGFELRVTGEVKMVVYDIFGRNIHSHIEVYEAGRHNLYFPPDNQITSLSSGIYFINAQYDNKTHIRKLVYIR